MTDESRIESAAEAAYAEWQRQNENNKPWGHLSTRQQDEWRSIVTEAIIAHLKSDLDAFRDIIDALRSYAIDPMSKEDVEAGIRAFEARQRLRGTDWH